MKSPSRSQATDGGSSPSSPSPSSPSSHQHFNHRNTLRDLFEDYFGDEGTRNQNVLADGDHPSFVDASGENPADLSGLTSEKLNLFQKMMKDSYIEKQCLDKYIPSGDVAAGKGEYN